MMNSFTGVVLCWLTAFVLLATAISVDDAVFEGLPNVDKMVGVHRLVLDYKTPPSVQTTRWQFVIKDDSDNDSELEYPCPEGSFLCGVSSVVLSDDKDKSIITELMSFSEKDTTIEKLGNDTWVAKANGKWGDDLDSTLELKIKCDESATTDVITWSGHEGNIFSEHTTLEWSHSAFCSKDIPQDGNDGTPGEDNGSDDDDDGLGWFTMFFIFVLALFGAYLVLQAWYNTSSMGSTTDFLNELFDVVVEHFSRIPTFIGEVLSRITGGSSNRGGYSAV